MLLANMHQGKNNKDNALRKLGEQYGIQQEYPNQYQP